MNSNIVFIILSALLFVLLILTELRHKLFNHSVERAQAEIIERQRRLIETQRILIRLYEKDAAGREQR